MTAKPPLTPVMPAGAVVTEHIQPTHSPGGDMTTAQATGVDLIAAERQRQIDAEGWTPDHDAQHSGDHLARAAICYALPADMRRGDPIRSNTPGFWPWEARYWKPTPDDRVRELVKAGALIAAEIDRLTAREQSGRSSDSIDTPLCDTPTCGRPMTYYDADRGYCTACRKLADEIRKASLLDLADAIGLGAGICLVGLPPQAGTNTVAELCAPQEFPPMIVCAKPLPCPDHAPIHAERVAEQESSAKPFCHWCRNEADHESDDHPGQDCASSGEAHPAHGSCPGRSI